MYDIIAVGSATVDAFVDTGSMLFQKTRVKGCYSIPFGSKIKVDEIKFSTGGGGTNTAVSFARMGFKTAFLGKIGRGTNSQRIFRELTKEKVDFSLAVRNNARTGFSIILDAKGHDRTILTYKGSNDELLWDEIDKKKIKTKWFYFASMTGKSFTALEKISEYSKENGIKIAFNPSSYLCSKGAGYMKKIFDATDVLCLNKEEAQMLVKGSSVKEMLRGLYKLVPNMVIITDGANGVSCYDGRNIYTGKAHKIKVVEATGAGDAFASGFLSGYVKTNDIRTAIEIGITDAESVISHFGAKNILLTWEEAKKELKKNPVDVKIEYCCR